MKDEDADALVPPAVPDGMAVATFIVNESRLLKWNEYLERGKRAIAVLVPQNSDKSEAGRSKLCHPIEHIRAHIMDLFTLMDPRTDASPSDSVNGPDGDGASSQSSSQAAGGASGSGKGKGIKWSDLREDPVAAVDHFKRAYGYLHKTLDDGVLQRKRTKILMRMVKVYYNSMSVRQDFRVNFFWKVFQRAFNKHIEDRVVADNHKREVRDLASPSVGDMEDLVETSSNGGLSMSSFDRSEGGGSTMYTRQAVKVTASQWAEFKTQSVQILKEELNSYMSQRWNDNCALAMFGDLSTTDANKAEQKVANLRFLDLVLYDDPDLCAEAVKALHRHFEVRTELANFMLNASFILDESSKDTLRYLSKKKLELQRKFAAFTNPFDASHVEAGELKNAQDIQHILFNDASAMDNVGLVNLMWTDLHEAELEAARLFFLEVSACAQLRVLLHLVCFCIWCALRLHRVKHWSAGGAFVVLWAVGG